MGDGSEEARDPALDAALGRLLDVGHQVPPHRLPTLIEDTARELGAGLVRIWLADIQRRLLVHLTNGERQDPFLIDGTAGGRAYAINVNIEHPDRDGRSHIWVPLVDGIDRVGVLELEVDDLTERRRDAFRHLAAAGTAALLNRSLYSDIFTVIRRRQPMSLASELQWQALPPTSFSTDDVTVAAMVEPAYETGGDTYDYAHRDGGMSLSVLDAVGHDLSATVVSTLALGAYRNQRRLGSDLTRMAEGMDWAILEQLGRGTYATGQLADLDTDTGVLRFLNAGHPLPLLIRDGRVLGPIACRPRLPFGLGHLLPDRPTTIAEDQLEPEDSVLFYTDGVIEARSPGGTDFGIERLDEFLQRAFAAHLPLAETVRRLSNAILQHHQGELQDDATTLLVCWHPTR